MFSGNHLGRKIHRQLLVCVFFVLSGNSLALCDVCPRIVSLAPSISEVIVSLGLAQNLVGVSRYDMPFEANHSVKSVGGYIDPNYEQVLALRPTDVFLLQEHKVAYEKLTRLGISVHAIEHRGIDGILKSFTLVGARCGVAKQAAIQRKTLQSQSEALTQFVGNSLGEDKRVRKALILLGDDPGTLRTLYISGRDGFFSDLLARVHATNIYHEQTTSLQGLSTEGLLQLDPDIIVQIADPSAPAYSRKEFLQKWQAFSELRAVREENVFYLQDASFHVPGPRFVKAQRLLAQVLYPHLDFSIGG